MAANVSSAIRLISFDLDDTLWDVGPALQAAEAAQEAGVDMLVFHHIVPPLPLAPLEDVFMEGVSDAYDGPAVIAVDGDFWSLPAGSDDIHHSERL